MVTSFDAGTTMSEAPAAPKPEGGEDKQDSTITIRVRDQVSPCVWFEMLAKDLPKLVLIFCANCSWLGGTTRFDGQILC